MSAFNEETVLSVRHWTPTLFSFTTTRAPSFRFESGQFTMIGLPVNGRPLMRAYSMASAAHDETLAFYSIKVPDGPLTQHLQKLKEGDTLLVSRKPVGTLVQDSLLPGKVLWLLSTGTGLAPFLSVMRDPAAYERFERVILVHGCRQVAELEHGRREVEALLADPDMGEMAREGLTYVPTVTREPFARQGRVTDLLDSGALTTELGLPPLGPERDRFMLCGSPAMLADTRALLEARGLREGSHASPGHFVIERAFVEK